MNNQFQQNQNIEKPKKTYWKFVFGFLGIVVVIGGGFFVWEKYFSPEAKSRRQMEKQYEAYMEWEKRYLDALKQDTYGGKTPEETLQMFIEALKKEDIELASKYFIIDTQNLREEWRKTLEKAGKEGKLVEIVNIISKAKPDLAAIINEDHYVFSVRDENGIVIADVDLQFNRESDIWKISSL